MWYLQQVQLLSYKLAQQRRNKTANVANFNEMLQIKIYVNVYSKP